MFKSDTLRKASEKSLTYYAVPFIIFAVCIVYLLVTDSFGSASGYYLIHYLYNYGHGFVARGLIGEIISWFYPVVTDEVTKGAVIIGAVMLAFGAALCIGKALNNARKDKDTFIWTVSFIIFLCLIPVTFRLYLTDTKLDKFLWALTLFAVFLADSKYGIYFVPVFCILATLVNPVFLFCSMLLVSLILLQKFYDSCYSVKNGFICGISYVSMIATGLFSTVSEKLLNFSSSEEFMNYYFSRYSGGVPENTDKFINEWLFDYFEPLDRIFKLAYEIYFKSWGNGKSVIISTLLFAVPMYAVLSLIWLKAIRREENKFQKFIFTLCMISPVVLIPPILISWESSKYFENNMVVQICLFVYYCCHNNNSVIYALESAKKWCKNHLIISSVFVLYLGLFLR